MARVVGTALQLYGAFTGQLWAIGVGTAISVGGAAVESSKQRRRARDAYNASLQDRLVMVDVSAAQARTMALGLVRTVEGVRRRWVSGPDLRQLTMFVSFVGHEIDGYEQFYFDDKALTLDADGFVTSQPYFRLDRKSSAKQGDLDANGAAVNIAIQPEAVPGTIKAIWFNRTASYVSGPLTVTVLGPLTVTLSGGPPGARYSVTWQSSDGQVTARVRSYLGTDDQNVGGDVEAEYPGNITPTDRFAGIAGALVDVYYDPDIYTQGRPTVTAVLRGAKVYDPRGDRRTSLLYPVLFEDAMSAGHAALGGALIPVPLEEMEVVAHVFTGGELRDVIKTYDHPEVEEMEVVAHVFTGGELRDVIKTYDHPEVEEMEVVAHAATGGEKRQVLFTYQNWPVEEMEVVAHAAIGGALS